MGLLRPAALALLALSGATVAPDAAATDWELDLDARLVNVDGPRPIIDGGLGALRYGDGQSGLRLGRARFALSQPLGQIWTLHLDASSWGDRDKTPVGLTEAYLQFRPYPWAGYRLRIKAGAFYAPISLENRVAGWESPYTLSYSAINSWLAQEVRTIGTEAQLDWLGTHSGHDFDAGLTAGLFGWNDNAGAALANGGFTLTDRQTVLWGRVGKPGVPPVYSAEPFHERSANAGAYGGAELRYLDRVVLRFLRYDNNASPGPPDPVTQAVAWNTQFNSAGLRFEAGHGWTAILQWLSGATYIAPEGTDERWPFRARFALLAKRLGPHTLSVRYDLFEVGGYGGGNSADDDGQQRGHALTAAYSYQPGPHWRCTLEWLHVTSTSFNRQEYEGTAYAAQTQVQLAVRYALGPLAR